MPEPDPDLCYLTATEALARFRARTLSPVELMAAVIARAEAVEPGVNALTFRHFDAAMAEARKAEARYARGARTRPLEGLPVAVKDEAYIRGLPTRNGSRLLEGFVADETSPVAERVLAAGGIVHARTATPEFSCAAVTWSPVHGVTRNPWNLAFTPGGSSGGAGAALASGSTTLATGSDIGGSIRIPSSCSGVVGLKPTYGRNPDDPPLALDSYNHAGPMARSVADLVLLQNVMCGPHPRDIATLRPKLVLPARPGGIAGWRIALSPDLGFYEVDAEVRRNLEAAAEIFRSLGAIVEEVRIPWTWDDYAAGMAHLAHGFGGAIATLAGGREAELAPYTRALLEMGARTTARDHVAAMERAARMYAELAPVFARHRLLLCPAAAVPAVPADFDPTRDEVRIGGRTVPSELGWVMTLPFNMLSRLPVLALPSGFAANGVPTGIQIVGRSFRDADVMRAGAAFEAAAGGWYGRGRRPALP